MRSTESRYGCPSCRAVFRSGFARCPLDGTPLQELVDDPLAGSMFADRYVIEACIGEGGMGRVYRARHQHVSRKFAIKVLYGDHVTDPKMRDRFAREAESASRLDHPNVVSVVDFGATDEGLLYLVMDFVEGRELTDVVAAHGALPADRVERILRGLCAGLVHAHDKGLVHRDFKGENVILTGDGDAEVPRIVDFGLAFMLEAPDDAGGQRLTTEGMVLGTPAYMSPEQATGVDLDHRTDLYSLGVLVYEMLAGVLPFEGSPMIVARKNLAAPPPPIAERVPGLKAAPSLEAIAMRLLEKAPRDRYQHAQDILDELDAAAAPAPPPVDAAAPPIALSPPVQTTTEAIAAATHDRKRWIIAAVVALAALGGALLLMLGGGGSGGGTATGGTGPDDAAPVAAVALDAAATPPLAAPTDAAAATARTIADAAPRKVRPRDRTKSDATPAVVVAKPPPDARPADTADAPITTRDLTARYKAAGEAIERLANARGAGAADGFRATYRKIPFADALRKPSLRREVDQKLRRLEAQVARALRGPQPTP